MPFAVHFVNNFAALLLLLFTQRGSLVGQVQPEFLLGALWWWMIVAVSVVLFLMVIRRFSREFSPKGDN